MSKQGRNFLTFRVKTLICLDPEYEIFLLLVFFFKNTPNFILTTAFIKNHVMLIQFQNSIRYAVTLNSGTFSEHNRELLIAVKRFELSVYVHVQLLFFY